MFPVFMDRRCGSLSRSLNVDTIAMKGLTNVRTPKDTNGSGKELLPK